MSAATRRDTLATLAGFLAVPAAAAPAAARAPNPDAALIALGERWSALHAAAEAAEAALHRAWDRQAAPDLPEAVFYRSEDDALGLDRYASARGVSGRFWYCVSQPAGSRFAGDADALRGPQTRCRQMPFPPGHFLHGTSTLHEVCEPWPERQARADEIVAASDEWRAACDASEIASGVRAAETEANRLSRLAFDVEKQIEAIQAHTFAGCAIKARVMQADFDRETEVRVEMLAGLVRDLLALAGPAGS